MFALDKTKTRSLSWLFIFGVAMSCTFTEATLEDNDSPTDLEPTPAPDPELDPIEISDPDPLPPIPPTQMEGLLGQWSMDENMGSEVNDSTSNLHHGVIRGSNSPSWVNGTKGSAINFDGENDVSFPPDSRFQPSSLTLSAWVKVDVDFHMYGWIVGEGDNFGLVVNRRDPGDLFFYFYNGAEWPNLTIPDVEFFDDDWHHMVATFDDATKTSSLYFDGVLRGTKVHEDSIVYAIESGIHIGSKTGERNFEGQIDEVHMFDRALSPAEVTALLRESIPVSND